MKDPPIPPVPLTTEEQREIEEIRRATKQSRETQYCHDVRLLLRALDLATQEETQ